MKAASQLHHVMFLRQSTPHILSYTSKPFLMRHWGVTSLILSQPSSILHTTSSISGLAYKGYRGWPAKFIDSLNAEERQKLMQQLQDRELSASQEAEAAEGSQKVTFAQLRIIAIAHGAPFIGFGFFDNLIMISAGGYIEDSFGAVLGISTMAAAALGNMVSDVFGITLVGYVEAVFSRLGLEAPPLTVDQMKMPSVRIASYIGRALAISIGCLLGMCPLFLFKKKKDSNDEENRE